MSEVTINLCDGPVCTAQQDKPEIGRKRNRWIVVYDGTPDDGMVTLHFCSWTCAGQFADAKMAHP